MPLVSKTFSEIITFTRASTATYFNSAGTLTSAAINEPRLDYNPSTLAAQGLLIEEARTNLITSSAVLPAGINVTITSDTFVAPDGTTTGDQILDNTTLGEHYTDSSFTPTATTNYTFSAFIKNIGARSTGFACLRLAGDFSAFVIVNLSTFTVSTTGGAQYVSSSIQAINNGWYKISVTGVSVSTTASVARLQVTDASNLTPYIGIGEGFAAWGRQLEAGAFPTSYIPTAGAQATRAADVASVNTLSPWYNASEGTLYAEVVYLGQLIGTAAATNVIQFSDGTVANRIDVRVVRDPTSPQLDAFVATASVTQMDSAGFQPGVVGTTYKRALAYATNNAQHCVNGTLDGATDTSITVPTGINVFTFPFSSCALYARRITYYPRRLSNAELQTLTT